MKFIEAIQEKTTATVEAFGGAVLFKIKILSPMEAEAAGLASSLVASSIIDHNELKKLAKQKDIFERVESEDATEEDLDRLLNMVKGFDPGKLMKIEEHQDKLLKQVIFQASEDNGETWADIIMVDTQDQMCSETNLLWCGAIPKEDRQAILHVAMKSHGEVVSHLQSFLGTGSRVASLA